VAALGVDASWTRYFSNGAEAVYRPLHLPTDASERASMPQGFVVLFARSIG
jgi:hypothetical protein